MAENSTAKRAYVTWLVAGLCILALFLIIEYVALVTDARRYAYYAILIERQLLTFVITGGALFAASWSTTLPRGQNAALAGVISSLALALISVHFELWKAPTNTSTVWVETLVTFNLTTFILLIVLPVLIAAFAVIMEGYRDRFADNHASEKEHSPFVGIVLWGLWAMLLIAIMLYDSKLLSLYETAEITPREYHHVDLMSLITSIITDREQLYAFLKTSATRPSNYLFPVFTIGATAAAQIIVREEIKRRSRRYSGHG